MSKKVKKIAKRQVLANPLALKTSQDDTAKEQLKTLLQSTLTNLFPQSQIPTAEVIDVLTDEEKADLFKIPKTDRSVKIKELKLKRRAEVNASVLPKDFQAGIVLGMKKGLRGLEKGHFRALVYDSAVNVNAIKCLFDKGKAPIIPLPGLSSLVRSITGFPALCVGFPIDVTNMDSVQHFQPLFECLDILIKKQSVKIRDPILAPIDPIPKEERTRPTKKNPKPSFPRLQVTLLTRASKSARTFRPLGYQIVVKEDNADSFLGDFVSFGKSATKKRTTNVNISKTSGYKKTKMEFM
jgi:hypothetical protein